MAEVQVVRVVDVDSANIERVLDLAVTPEQSRWVRPVAWYVARSAYEKVWQPVALEAGGEVVGFAEWAYDPSDGSYALGGVVVDAQQQGRGYGRAAMVALVALVREKPDCRLVALTVHEDNAVARRLYASLGFTETGDRDEDGELVMVLPAAADD